MEWSGWNSVDKLRVDADSQISIVTAEVSADEISGSDGADKGEVDK